MDSTVESCKLLDDLLGSYENLNNVIPITPSSMDRSPNINHNDNNINTIPSNEPQDDQERELKKRIQNRKAQKAFRLRKEAKLQDLEAKLHEAEQIQNELSQQVDSLRRDNIEMNKMNRQLNKLGQEQGQIQGQSQGPEQEERREEEMYRIRFPTSDEFYDRMIPRDSVNRHDHPVSSLQYNDEHGNVLLTIPATWQYLLQIFQEQGDGDEYDDDMNIEEIMASLRGHEMCHGHGAAYPKSLIDHLVAAHRRT